MSIVLDEVIIERNMVGKGIVLYGYTLEKNGSDSTGWFSIVNTSIDGKDCVNKWGGYNTRNVGAEKYIKRIWKSLKEKSIFVSNMKGFK